MYHHEIGFGWLSLLLLLSLSTPVFALKSDSEQPINIESNSAIFDESKGRSIYSGNVQVSQGSMSLNSDQLTIFFTQGKIKKLLAIGKPAKFKQTPEAGNEDINGEALTAEYYPEKALLRLIEQAVVWQGDNRYSSELIEYDYRSAVVKAGQKTTDTKRVHVILQPKEKNKTK